MTAKITDELIQTVVSQLENDAIKPYAALGPTLAVIHQADLDKGSLSYLTSLRTIGAEYGAIVNDYVTHNVSEAAQFISILSKDPKIHGIILISDYGSVMNRALYDLIPSRLDIDGLSYASIGRLVDNNSAVAYRNAPCTATACFKIMEAFRKQIDPKKNDFSNKTCLIVGRSIRVGRPLAEILTQQNMTVTLAHSKTSYSTIYDSYDYVVSAIGKPNFWNKDNKLYYSEFDTKCYVDVGMNVDEQGKLCGDIDRDWFNNLPNSNWGENYITPVVNGVGRVTTTVLFAKLFNNAAEMFRNAAGIYQYPEPPSVSSPTEDIIVTS